MPGWPLLAASTASIASVRIVLMAVRSRSCAVVGIEPARCGSGAMGRQIYETKQARTGPSSDFNGPKFAGSTHSIPARPGRLPSANRSSVECDFAA